eukprot:61547-Prymnesium_polylepis.2
MRTGAAVRLAQNAAVAANASQGPHGALAISLSRAHWSKSPSAVWLAAGSTVQWSVRRMCTAAKRGAHASTWASTAARTWGSGRRGAARRACRDAPPYLRRGIASWWRWWVHAAGRSACAAVVLGREVLRREAQPKPRPAPFVPSRRPCLPSLPDHRAPPHSGSKSSSKRPLQKSSTPHATSSGLPAPSATTRYESTARSRLHSPSPTWMIIGEPRLKSSASAESAPAEDATCAAGDACAGGGDACAGGETSAATFGDSTSTSAWPPPRGVASTHAPLGLAFHHHGRPAYTADAAPALELAPPPPSPPPPSPPPPSPPLPPSPHLLPPPSDAEPLASSKSAKPQTTVQPVAACTRCALLRLSPATSGTPASCAAFFAERHGHTRTLVPPSSLPTNFISRVPLA